MPVPLSSFRPRSSHSPAKKRWAVWKLWSESRKGRLGRVSLQHQSIYEIARLPVAPLAADDCALLLRCWSRIAIGLTSRSWRHVALAVPGRIQLGEKQRRERPFGGMGYYTLSDGGVCLFANVPACLTAQAALNSKEANFSTGC